MKTAIACVCCLLLAVPARAGDAAPAPLRIVNPDAKQYEIIDTHLHYLDFLQETDGFEKLVRNMDAANVPYAVLFGMAMAKQ